MKTLKEQVSEIMSTNASKAAKREQLKKLGITGYEISLMLDERLMGGDFSATTPRVINVTFGVEIECGLPRDPFAAAARANGFKYEFQGYNHRDTHTVFKFVHDGSLTVAESIECVSPILKGKKGKEALQLACKTLNEAGATVNKSCGLHVHIGAKDLNGEQYASVFANYYHLEKLIDTFMAASRRGTNGFYCQTLQDHAGLANCHTAADVMREISSRTSGHPRYHKVNPCSYDRHKTIEFRQHQGTTDFDKIFNWVQFCAKLVKWSMKHRLTSDITSIDEIPFLTKAEKEFFKSRAARLA